MTGVAEGVGDLVGLMDQVGLEVVVGLVDSVGLSVKLAEAEWDVVGVKLEVTEGLLDGLAVTLGDLLEEVLWLGDVVRLREGVQVAVTLKL